MNIRLLAVDVDGTLLNSKSVLTPFTRDVLIEMQQRGICLVLCSGRPLYMLKPLAECLCMREYGGFLVGSNGNAVCDLDKDEITYYHPLSSDIISSVYKKMKGYCLSMTIEGNHEIYEYKHPLYDIYSFFKNVIKKKTKKKNDYSADSGSYKKLISVDRIPSGMNKVVVNHLSSQIPDMRKRIEEMNLDISVLQVHKHSLEIQNKQSDKLFGLIKVLEKMHILSEEIMTIGDGENDICMIQYAKIGCAMKNALAGVKDVADVILDDNDHEGVAKGIIEYISEHNDSQYEKNNV